MSGSFGARCNAQTVLAGLNTHANWQHRNASYDALIRVAENKNRGHWLVTFAEDGGSHLAHFS
jgi:hypothetical protein